MEGSGGKWEGIRELGGKGGLKWKRYSEHGGDKPGKLLDEASRRVASGDVGVAVVVGGEGLGSRKFYILFFDSCEGEIALGGVMRGWCRFWSWSWSWWIFWCCWIRFGY